MADHFTAKWAAGRQTLVLTTSDVTVSEVSVARAVHEIREALRDEREIIRTVHSHGYAFVAPIDDTGSDRGPEHPSRHPVGWLISRTRTLPLHAGPQIIGRDPAIELVLDSRKVSRRHARIDIKGTQATIEDLGSKNGSFVGSVRVTQPTVLAHGDEVQIGRFKFIFRLDASPESTETEG